MNYLFLLENKSYARKKQWVNWTQDRANKLQFFGRPTEGYYDLMTMTWKWLPFWATPYISATQR